MDNTIKIVVGFDQRESVAFHVFTQSIIETASVPVFFLPLAINTLIGYRETHTDNSNDFIYIPFGWAHRVYTFVSSIGVSGTTNETRLHKSFM